MCAIRTNGAWLLVVMTLVGLLGGCDAGGEEDPSVEGLGYSPLRPRIQIEPYPLGGVIELDVADLLPGETLETTMVVFNDGDADLTIDAIEVHYEAPDPAADGVEPVFSCHHGSQAAPCGTGVGLPVTLRPEWPPGNPGDEFLFTVTYRHPGDGMARYVALAVRSDDLERGPQYLAFRADPSTGREAEPTPDLVAGDAAGPGADAAFGQGGDTTD